MRRKKAFPQTPPQLQQALDWLAGPPDDNPLLDVLPLRNHIATINSLALPVLHRLKIDELFQQRVDRIDDALTPQLLDVKLPLPSHLGPIAHGLIGLRAEMGNSWLKIAQEADPADLARVHQSKARLCLLGIANLFRQLVATLLTAAPMPTSFWRNVQALHFIAGESIDPMETMPREIGAIDLRLKAMLALTAAQPEGLAPREVAFLAEYLELYAGVTRIDLVAPANPGDWFWLDASLDQPPVSLARLDPPGDRCIYFRFGDLASLAEQHLRQLLDGDPPKSIGLPLQAAGADYRNALERSRLCWISPRHRNFNRRSQPRNVSVCTQLSSLWAVLQSETREEPESTECELTYSDWMLLNEGPAGYAVVHVVGAVSGIVPGCAVGLRTGAGAAWQICIVRWARSTSSGQLELGLELVAPSAKPVRIQASARRQDPPIPALLLPALPTLNRGEAILVGRGDCNANPFTLLQEHDAHLKVVECVSQRNLIETSSVDVFEFIRNSTPG